MSTKQIITMIENARASNLTGHAVTVDRDVLVGDVNPGVADRWFKFKVTAAELADIESADNDDQRWAIADRIRCTPMADTP